MVPSSFPYQSRSKLVPKWSLSCFSCLSMCWSSPSFQHWPAPRLIVAICGNFSVVKAAPMVRLQLKHLLFTMKNSWLEEVWMESWLKHLFNWILVIELRQVINNNMDVNPNSLLRLYEDCLRAEEGIRYRRSMPNDAKPTGTKWNRQQQYTNYPYEPIQT